MTMRLSTLMTEYLIKNRRIRASTRSMTRTVFRHLIDAVGDIDVAEFCYAEAEDFQGYTAEKTSRRSANTYVKTARPVFSWAVRRGIIEQNPFEDLPSFRITDEPVRVFTDDEVRAMLSVAELMWRARILAAVSAGLRRGEVLNLTWNDFDFDRKIIRIQPKKDTEHTWAWEPKDYECRDLPLVPQLENLLLLLRVELPLRQVYPFLPEKRWGTLRRRIGNIEERIRCCPDENFSRPFSRILARAQIKDGRSFHDLRRTAITKWAQSLAIRDVQKLAGHSSIETTERYYLALSPNHITQARLVSSQFGATGLEPATS